MLELNKVMLVGNLTRDPEVKYLPSGKAITNFSIAANRKWTDKQSGEKKQEATFVDITAWGPQAEFVGKYFKKGAAIFVEGRLKQDTWEDKNTGQKRSKLSIVAERVQFADSKPSGDEKPRDEPHRAERHTPDTGQTTEDARRDSAIIDTENELPF